MPRRMTPMADAPAEEGAERVPHDQRGRRRSAHPAARAALLGDQVPAGEAAEARRRPALLPARRYRAAAPDFRSAVYPGLYDQGRAAPAARGRRQLSDDIPPAAPDEREEAEAEAAQANLELPIPGIARPAGGQGPHAPRTGGRTAARGADAHAAGIGSAARPAALSLPLPHRLGAQAARRAAAGAGAGMRFGPRGRRGGTAAERGAGQQVARRGRAAAPGRRTGAENSASGRIAANGPQLSQTYS